MAKKIMAVVKLQIPAGKANPAPPVGPALGQHGVNIMGFCKEFNEKTAQQNGLIIPAEITIFEDRSFTFVLKTPPAAVLLKKAAGLETASGEPNRKRLPSWAGTRSSRNCRNEDGGLKRRRCRSRDADGGRHRPQHGHRNRRLTGVPEFCGRKNPNTT